MKSVAKFDKDISMDWPSQQKLGVIQQSSGRRTPKALWRFPGMPFPWKVESARAYRAERFQRRGHCCLDTSHCERQSALHCHAPWPFQWAMVQLFLCPISTSSMAVSTLDFEGRSSLESRMCNPHRRVLQEWDHRWVFIKVMPNRVVGVEPQHRTAFRTKVQFQLEKVTA